MCFFIFRCIFLLPVFFFLSRKRRSLKRVPPGSIVLPIIGQSLEILWAMRTDTADKWVAKISQKFGPISKLSLFGKPTVFIYILAANKFLFTSDGSKISNHQRESVKRILGDRCLLELSGEDHKRERNALASFLKPDCLKIGKLEEEIRMHCFRIVSNFQHMVEGMRSIRINLPFTRFNRSLKSRSKVRKMIKDLIIEKRIELEKGALSHQDLITSLLSIRGIDDRETVSDDEIIHKVMLIMVAGHDTASVLIALIVLLLANDPTIHSAVLKGISPLCSAFRTIIIRARGDHEQQISGEPISLEDLAKMKYSWRLAMEGLRTISPIFGGLSKDSRRHRIRRILHPKKMANLLGHQHRPRGC